MGLDVYVGSLTRYYAGDWELIAQQAAREIGVPLQICARTPTPQTRFAIQILSGPS
jgi:hypothetical protein